MMGITKYEYVRYWLYHNLPLAAGKQRNDILSKELDGIGTVLDIGCGMGFLKVFNRHYSIGVDIHEESLKIAKSKGRFADLIQCDVRNMPFTDKSFDGVVCSEVIEHLPKEDGYALIDRAEKLARRLVVFTTPWGADLLKRYSFNPYMQHVSGWLPEEFESRGYFIIPLHTLRYLKFDDYWWYSTMVHYAFSLLVSPLLFLSPRAFSDNFVAIKNLENGGKR